MAVNYSVVSSIPRFYIWGRGNSGAVIMARFFCIPISVSHGTLSLTTYSPPLAEFKQTSALENVPKLAYFLLSGPFYRLSFVSFLFTCACVNETNRWWRDGSQCSQRRNALRSYALVGLLMFTILRFRSWHRAMNTSIILDHWDCCQSKLIQIVGSRRGDHRVV